MEAEPAAEAQQAPEQQPGEKSEWCYLDMNRAHQGPFPMSYLQGLAQQGYFNPEALFWREGQPEWKPLRELPELTALLEAAAAAAGSGGGGVAATADGGDAEGEQEARPQPRKAAAVQSAAAAAAELAAGASGIRKPCAVLASAPVVAAPAVRAAPADEGGAAAAAGAAADPELAGFLAEISALEGEAGAEPAGDEVPPSPPPEERSFVDDDGTLYVWDPALRKFQPAGEQPVGYTEDDMVFVADEEQQPPYEAPPKADAEEDEGEEENGAEPSGAGGEEAGGNGGSKRTRQQEEAMDAARERAKKVKAAKAQQKAQQQAWFELKVNTSVYVTGLPEDVNEAELAEAFGKCGIIKEDEQHRPRIKIYRDKDTGRPKGDGLVTFLKEPSVELALQILDGAPLRYGLPPMSVSRAKFEQKGGEYVAKTDPGRKRAKKKVLQKLEKDLGWGGFDDVVKPQQVTVILKHMFHPDEFLREPGYKEELEADITAECAKLGPLDKVRVFQHNQEGVVSVKFKTEAAADECTRVMNGRFFAGRQLEAAKWDGLTNYNVKMKETEEEQQARLERFSKEIEQGAAPPEHP